MRKTKIDRWPLYEKDVSSEKGVVAKPSTSYYSRSFGMNEKIPSNMNVRYLYKPGELEGRAKRATDPFWSFKICTLLSVATKPTSLSSIICAMAGNEALSAKSCWLCPKYTASANSVQIT